MKKRRAKVEPPSPPPADPPPPALLEDWRPLSRCLGARWAEAAWLAKGAELFLRGQVPTAAHDSGAVATRGARVLWAWCEERAAAGVLPAEIIAVELAMGTGTHLRGLLVRFRQLCNAAGVDWAQRLRVLATDLSEDVTKLALGRQVFASLGVRVEVGQMDLRAPGLFRPLGEPQWQDYRGRIHFLVAYYALDLLPVDLYRQTAAGWEIAAVRAEVGDVAALEQALGMTLAAAQALAAQAEPASAATLLAAQPHTRLRLRTLPFSLAEHPDAAELERIATSQRTALGPEEPSLQDGVVVHYPVGAMQVVPLLLAALADDGFALLRDVGLVTPADAAQARLPQRFGATWALPLNFVQLDDWMQRQPGCVWRAPPVDGVRDHAMRWLGHGPLPATERAFAAEFATLDAARDWVGRARAATEPAAALEAWRQAALAEPDDWLILQEAAAHALELGQAQLALAIAAHGLELNPVSSPTLWRLVATAHALVGDPTAAVLAARQGLAVSPIDAGLHVTLARLGLDAGDTAEAFRHLGEALAADTGGQWRELALALLDAALRASARQAEAALPASPFV